jgi:hypothetical protein
MRKLIVVPFLAYSFWVNAFEEAEFQIEVFDKTKSNVVSSGIEEKILHTVIEKFREVASDTARGADYYLVECGPDDSYFVSSVRNCEQGNIKRTSVPILKNQIFIEDGIARNQLAEITIGVGHCAVSMQDIPIEIEVLNE